MADERANRKMSAILSADVKGYSRLMSLDEEGTVKALNECRDIIASCVNDYRGRVVDSPGDNVLTEFVSTVEAVRCAVKIQEKLGARNANLPQNSRMEFRIGVNLGDVIEEKGRIYGDGVNIAARLEGLAEAGGICISGTAFDQVKGKLTLGYLFVGQQTVKNIPDPIRVYKVLMAPEDAGKIIGEDKPKKWRRIQVAAVLLVAIAVAFFISNIYFGPPPIESASVDKMAYPLPDKPSIVVLPFENMSGNPEEDYFSDGLTEQIITTLSTYPRLFVITRQSAFHYKGKPVKIQKVAEDLGVQYVLKGGVQKSGDKIRITAQLIDAISGSYIWSERYDRQLKDIFDLQDEITANVLNGMVAELAEGEQARRWTQRVTNLKALEKHYRAQGFFCRHTKEDYDKAQPLFEEAIELEPNFVWPYVYLGYSHLSSAARGWTKSPAKSLQIAYELSQKALAIDESHDGAHTLLAGYYNVSRQYDKALVEAERAMALNPNAADAPMIMGSILSNLGKWEEAVLYGNKSLRLNPFPGAYIYYILGRAYFMTEQYDESIAICKKAIKVSPNFLPAHLYLAACYSSLNRDAEATAAAKEVIKINPKFNIESYAKRLLYKNKSDKERELNALRKAGLPYTPPLSLPDKPSIAVLAFDNLSGDPEQEYFSDGIAENIITALSKVGELFVIARNSSFTYKGKPVKVQRVGRELGVKYVLEGSVQKSGDRLRITSQLIDAKNGQHVWAERYDRVLKDIFAIQDDITKRVVSSLQANLTVGEITRAYARGTNSLEAYLKVMKARNIHMRFTKNDNLISRDLTQEAIAIDPEYGEAYVLLAATYMLETLFESEMSPKELMGRAIKYAKKAVELETVGGHSMLGHLYGFIGQIDKGLSECKIAVDLAPNSASARTWYGAVLIKAGQYDMAVEQLEQALRRDPMAGTWSLRYLGSAYSWKGRHEEAISTLKKASEKAPKDYLSRLFLTRAYIFAGRPDDAKAEAAEVIRLNPDFSLEKFAKTYNAKDKDRAINALRQAGLK